VPYVYGGPLADVIVATKFRRKEELAHGLGRLLADAPLVHAAAAAAAVIVPIPLGRARRRERGFNQSAILARELGRATRTPVGHLLVRVRNTRPQSDLAESERAANVEAAFRARRAVPERCLLVDDVVTSTETVRAAALALSLAGATEITVVALARTPLG